MTLVLGATVLEGAVNRKKDVICVIGFLEYIEFTLLDINYRKRKVKSFFAIGALTMNWFQSGIRTTEKLGRTLVSVMRKIRRPVTSAVGRVLIQFHVNQSHLTLGRIILLIGFYFAFVSSFFSAAMILMLTVWILDCQDGDLSRMLGHDTPLGEFEDVMADNFACLIFPLALIQTRFLNGVLGALFIFSSFSVVWLVNRNQPRETKGDELNFLPKGGILLSLPTIVIWLLMACYLLFRINIFNLAYLVVTIILCLSTAFNYYQIIKSRL